MPLRVSVFVWQCNVSRYIFSWFRSIFSGIFSIDFDAYFQLIWFHEQISNYSDVTCGIFYSALTLFIHTLSDSKEVYRCAEVNSPVVLLQKCRRTLRFWVRKFPLADDLHVSNISCLLSDIVVEQRLQRAGDFPQKFRSSGLHGKWKDIVIIPSGQEQFSRKQGPMMIHKHGRVIRELENVKLQKHTEIGWLHVNGDISEIWPRYNV